MFLHDEAEHPIARLLLAHGAGAPMDHPWMEDVTARLLARQISVTRFEFAFMAARREGGKARPAPRGDKLMPEYLAAVERLAAVTPDGLPLFIGGKSLGGRVATLAAPDLLAAGRISGLVCFGYPFHPPKKPETLRTVHLAAFACPALILQGTRDPLGSRDEVASYTLDPRIEFLWLEDGDHDLAPRKRSGYTAEAHLDAAADKVAKFIARQRDLVRKAEPADGR